MSDFFVNYNTNEASGENGWDHNETFHATYEAGEPIPTYSIEFVAL